MGFDPVIAAVRYGMGRSPVVPDPDSVDDMLTALAAADRAAAAFPIPGYTQTVPSVFDLRQATAARRDARGTDQEETTDQAVRDLRQAANKAALANVYATYARAITAHDGLRERLVAFWADHFTVRSRVGVTRHMVTPYVEDAIRPHVSGRFADMLITVMSHPMMLNYLDQTQSIGPNTPAGQRRSRGLNENLAREMLELHTLGVGGSYDQADVRQMAELFTGLTVNQRSQFQFRARFAEPGAEVVLGQSYGGDDEAQLDDIFAALSDIAAHPDTARHLARKLAVHFVSDDPPEALVAALEARWLETGGDLFEVTQALLSHPGSWSAEAQKVKPPQQFIMSSLRALGVPLTGLAGLSAQDAQQMFGDPLVEMGQPWEAPPGPNGWPEAPEAWITPQGMAARITWAMTVPVRLSQDLPDPRVFAQTALGPDVPQSVRFAASAAENVAEGVGIVLASAAFQRR